MPKPAKVPRSENFEEHFRRIGPITFPTENYTSHFSQIFAAYIKYSESQRPLTEIQSRAVAIASTIAQKLISENICVHPSRKFPQPIQLMLSWRTGQSWISLRHRMRTIKRLSHSHNGDNQFFREFEPTGIIDLEYCGIKSGDNDVEKFSLAARTIIAEILTRRDEDDILFNKREIAKASRSADSIIGPERGVAPRSVVDEFISISSRWHALIFAGALRAQTDNPEYISTLDLIMEEIQKDGAVKLEAIMNSLNKTKGG